MILLDTRFPRPPGDIGHPATFGGQGIFEVVPGASVARALSDGSLASDFLKARDRLVAQQAEAITTSCGMLVRHQEVLQRDCPVPVVCSSLLQIADRSRERGPASRIGVLAMDSRLLDPADLERVGAPANTVVAGVEGGTELLRVLSANDPAVPLDPVAARADVIAAGKALHVQYPDLAAIVLECANLPPYRAALERRLGLPVYDLITLLAETLDSGDRQAAGFATAGSSP